MGSIVHWPKEKQEMGGFPSEMPRLAFQVSVYLLSIENAEKNCLSLEY